MAGTGAKEELGAGQGTRTPGSGWAGSPAFQTAHPVLPHQGRCSKGVSEFTNVPHWPLGTLGPRPGKQTLVNVVK